MNVEILRSRKMPTLNSYYLSNFSEATYDELRRSKPFSFYHRALKQYEVTESVYETLTEPIDHIVDKRINYPQFERKSKDLYGYQVDAVEFAGKTRNLLINFAQGMGKTLTTLQIVLERQLKRTLIVCGQGNLQEEWIKDAKKHNLLEKLNLQIVGGDSSCGNQKKVQWLASRGTEPGVDLINIEALRSVKITAQLNLQQYDCIVVDEVQAAKGWSAEQTKGLHELVHTEEQYRIALSGTPVLNDPLEFFSVLKFLSVLKDTAKTTFEKYYGEWSFDFWGHYICKGYKNLADLAELLQPVLCYVGKSELSLPTKTRSVIKLDWEPSERFRELMAAYKLPIARLRKRGFKTKAEVYAEMQFLGSTDPEKIKKVIGIEERCLVFSQYTRVLDEYREALKAAGKSVLYYHGALTMSQRLEVLEEWRNGDAQVLLLSVMAARYGLNLTEATVTVFLEPPPSLSVLEQCEDRAHRIGQTQPCHSYLLSSTHIDTRGLENIVEKQDAIEALNDLVRAGE